MSITIIDGGTTTTTGGTERAFSRTSKPVNGGYEYSDVAETNFFARRSLVLTSKMPQRQSDGTYSRQVTTSKMVIPFTRADGSVVNNVVEVKIAVDPEAAPTLLAPLREGGAQLAKDAELDATYQAGTFPA
jgi:hypothetical protein